MITLDKLHRDTSFDRFEICLAYHALEYDWNDGGWVRERPTNQRNREAISIQLGRIGFSPGMGGGGGFSSLLPLDEDCDEHEAARESYIHALIAWGLASKVDPDDDLGKYIMETYVGDFIEQWFPQLITDGWLKVPKSSTYGGETHFWHVYERKS